MWKVREWRSMYFGKLAALPMAMWQGNTWPVWVTFAFVASAVWLVWKKG